MYANILIPVSFDGDSVAVEAMRAARALAREGARFTLLHVIEQLPSHALSQVSPGYREETRRAVQAGLSLLAEQNMPEAQTVVMEGHAGRALLEYAGENGVDCIVIASHRPGLQNYFLGSTASHVVRQAHCSVHVIR